MCVHFTPPPPPALRLVARFEALQPYPAEAYPNYYAPVIRAESHGLKATIANFGLIPHWSKDKAIGKRTYNARTETVQEKPSYRGAWSKRQFCLVPMLRFFEPNWESGKSVNWQIHRQDNELFAVAGIWENWTDKETGEYLESFSMLTINADNHPIIGKFHRPGDEKRSLVVIEKDNWFNWLNNKSEIEARKMLQPMNVDLFETSVASVASVAV